jgi:pimeloyl-ACP methyl ester carboxylesterase
VIERPRHPIITLACVIGLALVAAACANPLEAFGDDQPPVTIGSEPIGPVASGRADQSAADAGSGVDSGQSAGNDFTITAEFLEGPCRFEVPPGYEPRCGTVAVPADWETGDGTVLLPVAVFASTADQPEADPVIYLDGGPGSHALETIQYVVDDFLAPLTERGDVIFFDQRGAGLAEPRLNCDETTDVQRQTEDDPEIETEAAIALFHDALARCRARLIGDGIDLTDYNSINNAADVEAIRIALGYQRWNLFGVSYGTKLGLEVLRRHPEAVRSAVLDSVYPPQVDSVLENPTTFLDSYQEVMAACRAERPGCGDNDDLDQRIRDVIDRYEAEPVEVGIRDWIGGVDDTVVVTGQTILDTILGALYSTWQLSDIPELIAELEAGDTTAMAEFLSQDRSTERYFTDGMFYAIACHEEISFADPAEVASSIPDDPFGLTEQFDLASNTGNLAFGTCEAFANGQAPEVSNTAVVSDVPTLLMAGRFDPVTPISWAELAADTLSASRLVIGPNASHGVSGDQCGISVAREFLDNPERAPDDSCLLEAELPLLAPSAGSIELEPLEFRSDELGVEIISVAPSDWGRGSLVGDQYRNRSFLDPTEFYQLAGDAALGDGLENFIETEKGVTLTARQSFDIRVGPIAADDLPGRWQYRSAQPDDAVRVDWFETEIDGQATYVILVSAPEEREALLEDVVGPALAVIEVRGL